MGHGAGAAGPSDLAAPSADPGVRWLLGLDEPSVRYWVLTDLLDYPAGAPEVRAAGAAIASGPRVTALFSGQEPDGGFGCHPYRKWTGAHWRLVALAELGLPEGDPRARAAADQVLRWLDGRPERRTGKRVRGLARMCASQEGNAVGACSRLGFAGDPRVARLAEHLLEWQWPDGGWNCDKRPEARHSSFYESLATAWGLAEYARATGSREAAAGARRTAEFFLRHRLFRSERTGEVINPHWVRLHWPLYFHYDVLQALRLLALLDCLHDPRADEALSVVAGKRRADGTWRAEGYYWRPPGKEGHRVEVVDWGRRGPNPWLTLNALRVLKRARRWPPGGATSTRPACWRPARN